MPRSTWRYGQFRKKDDDQCVGWVWSYTTANGSRIHRALFTQAYVGEHLDGARLQNCDASARIGFAFEGEMRKVQQRRVFLSGALPSP